MLLMSWDKLSKSTWGLYERSHNKDPEIYLILHFFSAFKFWPMLEA